MGHVIELKVHQGFNTEMQGEERPGREMKDTSNLGDSHKEMFYPGLTQNTLSIVGPQQSFTLI